ncbi:TonB-dependent receptor [Bacteroides caecigallinarum]|uniref:TonB-dependent receptor n=1 Tax=Bacteroides caecigallinarum TaxID=1411144 RepID=UPI001F420FFB|nr:TonB-dependent receptor [Bacteroides caecigallinarum]MCF2593201.1 TonB-dependent receptor [Bacteroides caecigallinarum]
MNNFIRLFLGVTAMTSAMDASAGILKGSVVDKKTGEPIIGATITVAGTNIGAITDYDGNYEINVPDGEEYEIEVRYVSYKNLVLDNIKVKGETINNIELEEESVVLGGIEVVASLNRESENFLLLEQKKSVLSRQAVGAKELSRKGVSDAEGAVQKISGISKQEGVKNVFVRGLGDRYNTTMLNGFPIPSEDPEYKNISLSFFDTDVIQSVGVNKVFSASGAGDAAGAVIDIQSKELIGQDMLEVGGSFGLNTQTVSQPFYIQNGAGYMGISNKAQPGTDLSTFGFKNSLDPKHTNFNPDHSYSVAAGNKFYVGEDLNPLNVLVLANYSQSNTFTDEIVRNTTTNGTIYQDQKGEKYERNISQMLLGNVNYLMKNDNELSYNLMMIHSNNQYVADYLGMSDKFQSSDRSQGFMRRQQANDNLLVVNQINSSWKLSDKWKLNAGLAYNYVSGNEPDRRINYLSETETENLYTPTRGTGSQQRYFSELTEHDLNMKIEAIFNLPDKIDGSSMLKFGYTGRMVKDAFEAVEYDMSAIGSESFNLNELKLDNFFNQNNLTAGKFSLDRNNDIYDVKKYINAVYADATYRLAESFTANVGVRMDYVLMNIDYNVNRGGDQGSEDINKPFILPSLNFKYDVAEKHSLRLGLSKTYTLPQSKEISPFRYIGVNFKSQGNQNLKPSDNYNIDLKWDFYPSAGELISVGVFYKYIQNPISRIEIASAGGYLSYENISDCATAAGVEFELRKDIFKHTAGEALHKMNFGLNGAYTYTMAKVEQATDPTGSQLEGAAPFIGNADITYQFKRNDFGITGTIVCNYFSDRVYTIGTQGYKDIIEKGVPTLDIVIGGQINKHLSLDLKMKNLINPSYQLFREASGENNEKIILNDYTKGRNFSIGLTYKF